MTTATLELRRFASPSTFPLAHARRRLIPATANFGSTSRRSLFHASRAATLVGNSRPGHQNDTNCHHGGGRTPTLTRRPLGPIRSLSFWSSVVPEFAQHWTIWGGTGLLLKTFHQDGQIPYWACMSMTNLVLRTSLLPLVVEAAHVGVRFSKVAPEVQFLITIYQNDLKRLRTEGAPFREQWAVSRVAMKTLNNIYQIHKINPLAVFKSPLLQLPLFWYFSVDIRKIIYGADPELAQQLTESGFLWITNLTDPDPWHGLPILTGALLYLNVELNMGRRTLSGETASKSNMAKFLKDSFQSLSIFMPCFMSQSPAGVQIYLLTSFVFTLFQSAALRYDPIRAMVGLPSTTAPVPQGDLTQEFIALKKLEKEAVEAWGGDPENVMGIGVMLPGWKISFPGSHIPSTMALGPFSTHHHGTITAPPNLALDNMAPPQLLVETDAATAPSPLLPKTQQQQATEASSLYFEESSAEVMEAANQGILKKEPQIVSKMTMTPSNSPKLATLAKKSKKSSGPQKQSSRNRGNKSKSAAGKKSKRK